MPSAHPNPHATYQTPPPQEPLQESHPEPRSFEKLMKPVSQAISRKGDSPPTPLSATSTRDRIADCTCDRALSATTWSLPLRRDADGLVATYFSRSNRIYPIIHQRTFRRQYERLWESGSGAPIRCSGLCRKKNACKLFAATLQAIFALATLFAPERPGETATRADAFFRQAQGLNFLDMLDDETGLELVQLGLVMGFYLQGTERFSKCWNVTGLAIRLAQNMGLHLGLAEARKRGLVASRPTQLEYEMRSRVWYGCVVLER
ncbi:fungal specific transcription factor domain-containing protein [Candidatus Bathyarchaeota archaeon]|nr:fungal specific transcription factor domain-containing protein [Candidatus Bathyarchaeota archaeon]